MAAEWEGEGLVATRDGVLAMPTQRPRHNAIDEYLQYDLTFNVLQLPHSAPKASTAQQAIGASMRPSCSWAACLTGEILLAGRQLAIY
jgi:hypothetical protein